MDNKAKALINACRLLNIDYCINNSSSIYDTMDIEKPDIVLNFSRKLVDGIPEFSGVTFISQTPHVIDLSIYKKVDKDVNFAVDILGWDELGSPDIDMKEFSSLSGKSRRLFSPRRRSGPCYCGFVHESLYSTIISSADKVITFDEKSYLNAKQCNDNVSFGGELTIKEISNIEYIKGLVA
jgi:hypothetical protein